MNKAQAIVLVAAVAAFYPDVTNFFVTSDEAVHVSAEEAVAKAIELSPGNPEVITVSKNELPEVNPQALIDAEKEAAEKEAADKLAADKEAADKEAAVKQADSKVLKAAK